jgi:8-oxo-dGTP pyrophosphatase MutT (NUDIX family)
MFITADTVRAIEERYGSPLEKRLSYEMTARELDAVRRSQKHGRAHDVTLFIVHDNKIVVIKKPLYPPGAYRAPGGGISPGEPFEDGAKREAYEETGLRIALLNYVARFQVSFTCAGDTIDWTTHVLSAEPTGGLLEPVDTHEIAEARYASVAELRGSINKALLESGSTGLHYRAELSEIVVNRLVELGTITE